MSNEVKTRLWAECSEDELFASYSMAVEAACHFVARNIQNFTYIALRKKTVGRLAPHQSCHCSRVVL